MLFIQDHNMGITYFGSYTKLTASDRKMSNDFVHQARNKKENDGKIQSITNQENANRENIK